jgi:putative acetyltransferase
MTTSTPSHPPAAPAWTIRPEQPIDLDQVHDLYRTTFAGPATAELVDAVRSGPDFLPDLTLVAVTDDGSVLGHVLVSRVALQPAEEGAPRLDILALGPVAILPPHQGRGIGTALIREALAVADTHDEPFTVVLGSPALFGRFGFVPAADLGVTGPYESAGEAFAVRPRPGASAIPSGTVVYPPAFAPG